MRVSTPVPPPGATAPNHHAVHVLLGRLSLPTHMMCSHDVVPQMAIAFLATRPRAMCAPRTLIQYSEFKVGWVGGRAGGWVGGWVGVERSRCCCCEEATLGGSSYRNAPRLCALLTSDTLPSLAQLDNEALHISTPVNDCCWWVDRTDALSGQERPAWAETCSPGCCRRPCSCPCC